VACMNNINIWGQNLEGYFKDAIETKTINDWMIAVAPSVNYEYTYIFFSMVLGFKYLIKY